jgi:hypothetical protein
MGQSEVGHRNGAIRLAAHDGRQNEDRNREQTEATSPKHAETSGDERLLGGNRENTNRENATTGNWLA